MSEPTRVVVWNGADTHSVSLCGRLDKTSGYVGPSTNGSQRRRCDDGLSNHPRRQVCGTSGQHLAALVVKSETEEKFTRSNDESVLSVDLVDASSLTTWTILYTTYLGRIIQIFVVGCCGRQSACQLRICLNRYSIGEPSVVLRIQQIHTGRRDQSCIMHHASCTVTNCAPARSTLVWPMLADSEQELELCVAQPLQILQNL